MKYEVIHEELTYNKNHPFHFLKWGMKTKELLDIKVKDDTDFSVHFTFADSNDKNDSKFKNIKLPDFALNWFKEKNRKIYLIDGKARLESISGIINKDKLGSTVSSFIPNSFIIHAEIELKTPYYSSDDDNFYLIDNPCLKEKVFKVPMVRGSGWKGAIASGFRELINEALYKINDNNKNNIKNLISLFKSYLRIFGTGSEEFKSLSLMIKKFIEKNEKIFKDILINYLLFELGLKLTKSVIDFIKNEDNNNLLKNILIENLITNNINYPIYLQTHKGRAIFYPTYFDKLSLEIINPHSRKTRAGTNPIHYEVVPEELEGILQIVYIPFDGVIRKNNEIKEEAEEDLKNLARAIEKTKEKGIGAKEKLGWGRFDLMNKKAVSNNENVNIPVGWR